jgi:hypothetical protein
LAKVNIFPSFLFAVDSVDSDVLICGECQTEFALNDIVRFIKHKVKHLNKENCQPYDSDDNLENDEDTENMLISNRRPSISAPMARKGTPELRDKMSPRPAHLQNVPMNLSMDIDDNAQELKENESKSDFCSTDDKGTSTPPRPQQVDAESNTNNTGTVDLIIFPLRFAKWEKNFKWWWSSPSKGQNLPKEFPFHINSLQSFWCHNL